MEQVLEKIEKQSRRQLLFTKILCMLCALMLICTLVLTLSITGAVQEILTITQPLQQMADQAGTVMANLDTVAQDLADADLGSMVENVNTLAADSQTVITEAMKKLDTIDIDTLNQAIADLADVVEPLAKVSKFFG